MDSAIERDRVGEQGKPVRENEDLERNIIHSLIKDVFSPCVLFLFKIEKPLIYHKPVIEKKKNCRLTLANHFITTEGWHFLFFLNCP